jgi:signal transduction histidine kinase
LFWFGFMAARPGRHDAAKLFGVPVDEGEVEIGEAHDPVAGFGLGDADGLADQRLAEEEIVAALLDLAVGAHAPGRMVGVIPGFFDLAGIGPGRGAHAYVTDILQSGRHLLSIVNQLLDMALIGLALTKRLIEGLGGRIEVDSETGKGSRFTVWLPVSPNAASGKSAAA